MIVTFLKMENADLVACANFKSKIHLWKGISIFWGLFRSHLASKLLKSAKKTDIKNNFEKYQEGYKKRRI